MQTLQQDILGDPTSSVGATHQSGVENADLLRIRVQLIT
jgi:hypothetical protein